jgi:hypothetical protein
LGPARGAASQCQKNRNGQLISHESTLATKGASQVPLAAGAVNRWRATARRGCASFR